MTLHELLPLIPATTPIRIYGEGNPYRPLIELIYSDTLQRKDNTEMLSRTVSSIHAAIHNTIPYVIVWLY